MHTKDSTLYTAALIFIVKTFLLWPDLTKKFNKDLTIKHFYSDNSAMLHILQDVLFLLPDSIDLSAGKHGVFCYQFVVPCSLQTSPFVVSAY